jgi:hypothetical protein
VNIPKPTMPNPITKTGVKQHIAVTTAPQIPSFKHFFAPSDFVIITVYGLA